MASNTTSEPIDIDAIILEGGSLSQSIAPCTTLATEQHSSPRPAIREGKALKWSGWMDRAVVRQVLATDPINCARGNTVAKWAEVSSVLQKLEPQPVNKSPESCRQRVKKLVEIYKVS